MGIDRIGILELNYSRCMHVFIHNVVEKNFTYMYEEYKYIIYIHIVEELMTIRNALTK